MRVLNQPSAGFSNPKATPAAATASPSAPATTSSLPKAKDEPTTATPATKNTPTVAPEKDSLASRTQSSTPGKPSVAAEGSKSTGEGAQPVASKFGTTLTKKVEPPETPKQLGGQEQPQSPASSGSSSKANPGELKEANPTNGESGVSAARKMFGSKVASPAGPNKTEQAVTTGDPTDKKSAPSEVASTTLSKGAQQGTIGPAGVSAVGNRFGGVKTSTTPSLKKDEPDNTKASEPEVPGKVNNVSPFTKLQSRPGGIPTTLQSPTSSEPKPLSPSGTAAWRKSQEDDKAASGTTPNTSDAENQGSVGTRFGVLKTSTTSSFKKDEPNNTKVPEPEVPGKVNNTSPFAKLQSRPGGIPTTLQSTTSSDQKPLSPSGTAALRKSQEDDQASSGTTPNASDAENQGSTANKPAKIETNKSTGVGVSGGLASKRALFGASNGQSSDTASSGPASRTAISSSNRDITLTKETGLTQGTEENTNQDGGTVKAIGKVSPFTKAKSVADGVLSTDSELSVKKTAFGSIQQLNENALSASKSVDITNSGGVSAARAAFGNKTQTPSEIGDRTKQTANASTNGISAARAAFAKSQPAGINDEEKKSSQPSPSSSISNISTAKAAFGSNTALANELTAKKTVTSPLKTSLGSMPQLTKAAEGENSEIESTEEKNAEGNSAPLRRKGPAGITVNTRVNGETNGGGTAARPKSMIIVPPGAMSPLFNPTALANKRNSTGNAASPMSASDEVFGGMESPSSPLSPMSRIRRNTGPKRRPPSVHSRPTSFCGGGLVLDEGEEDDESEKAP